MLSIAPGQVPVATMCTSERKISTKCTPLLMAVSALGFRVFRPDDSKQTFSRVFLPLSLYIYIYICIYIYIHTYIHTHIYIYIYIHMLIGEREMDIYIYICKCICTFNNT